MDAKDAFHCTSALLRDYLERFDMCTSRGPLRALGNLVSGILWTGSVQLTNAARLLADTPLRLAHEADRLSLQLENRHWDHREWMAAVLQSLADQVQPDDLIPIDGTDLAKPYARRMQWQCTVQDASRPYKPLVQGYWCFGSYAWKPTAEMLHSLILRPWSQNAPGFVSENDCIDRWFWSIHQALGDKGIWLMDRGFDRPEIFTSLLRFQKRWIVRIRDNRTLIGPQGQCKPAIQWALEALATRPERGLAVTLPVRLPPERVRQAPEAPPLWLVVPTYGYGQGKEERWLLLTRGLIGNHVGPRQIRHDYALRWRAEDARRFFGQIWHFEKFLTRSFLALERMLTCVTLASGFITLLQEHEPDICNWLENSVLRLPQDDEPQIRAYRIARGLSILAGSAKEVYSMTVNA